MKIDDYLLFDTWNLEFTPKEDIMFDLSGKVALVTGGSRGIGKGICLSLAKAGADVAINYISSPEKAEEVKKEIESLGRKAITVQTDVSQKTQVQDMINKVIAEMGKIDILVNNAGILTFAPFLEMPEEVFTRTLDVNLKGQFLVAQAVANQMVREGSGGKIINVASIASGQIGIGFPSISHYCATKGAIVAMSEAMSLELAPHKINVTVIAPGAIESDMTKGMLSDPKQMEAFMSRIPKKRIGTPFDIGVMAVFLASDESDYVTGSVFYVDGGYLAG